MNRVADCCRHNVRGLSEVYARNVGSVQERCLGFAFLWKCVLTPRYRLQILAGGHPKNGALKGAGAMVSLLDETVHLAPVDVGLGVVRLDIRQSCGPRSEGRYTSRVSTS